MPLQSLDITRRSATTTASPSVRSTTEVAKLIDVSKCIGCKACQVACSEWNDLRDEIGHTVGIPIHWGFMGVAKNGYIANTLTPYVGDANTQTPEFKAFLVDIEKA